MAIDLNAIRSFSANQSIVFNEQHQSIEKAGVRHSMGVFFGTLASVARNEATLRALRQAITGDPRYAGVRNQANELLDQVRTDGKINAAQIQSILTRLDQLSTPAEQRKLLLERFTLHLAARDLPPGWAGQAQQIRNHFDKRLGAIIQNAPEGVAHHVNVSTEIHAIENQLATISEACTDETGTLDQDTFKVMASIFAKRSDALETPEQTKALAGRVQTTLAEARQLAAVNPGVNFVDLAVRMMGHITKPAAEGVLTALHTAAQTALADVCVMDGLEDAPLTANLDQMLKGLFRVVNENIRYPEGVKMNDTVEVNAAVNFIFHEVAASLPRHKQEAIFEQLTSAEGRNLRLFYEEISVPATVNTARVYDVMTETLAEILGREVEPLDSETKRSEMTHMPASVLAPYVNENANCKLAYLKHDLGLSAEEAQRFDGAIKLLLQAGNSPARVARAMSDATSPMRRMLAYPSLSATAADVKTMLDLLTKFDTVFQQSGLPQSHKAILERFVFEEVAYLKETTGKLPDATQFSADLSSPTHPFMDFAKWGFQSTENVRSLEQMPAKYRRPIIAALKAFANSTDDVLFNKLVSKRDAIVQLAKRNHVTRENVLRTLVGRGEWMNNVMQLTEARDIKYCFQNHVHDILDEKEMEGIVFQRDYVFNLMCNYDISFEDARAIATGERPYPSASQKINIYLPSLLLAIRNDDVETALDGLQRDLPRINNGYATKESGRCSVPDGATFTFHLGNKEVTYSSLPTQEMTQNEREDYGKGIASPVSNQLFEMVTALCGKAHPHQIARTLLAMGASGLGGVRMGAAAYNVVANEHSQAKYELARLENGDVTIRISNPDNCPLEFNWTYTIKPDGTHSMSDVHMRRAEGV